MNKAIVFISLIMLVTACNNNKNREIEQAEYDSLGSVIINIDSSKMHHSDILTEMVPPVPDSNKSFRQVTVERLPGDSFVVRGKARIFEAVVEWVIEDGHSELYKGFKTASAGAPEWGDFEIAVKAHKKMPNSRLHMLLFWSSPKDGNRVDELPVYLY